MFSSWLDTAITAMSVRLLRTPVQAPIANAYCGDSSGRYAASAWIF